MKYKKIFLVVIFALFFLKSNAQDPAMSDDPVAKPQVLKDSATNFTYVLDTSKTYISCFDADGHILWKIDPYKNGNYENYMFKKTKIHSMKFGQNPGYRPHEGKKGEKVIWIYYGFQWGYIHLKTGKYYIVGDD